MQRVLIVDSDSASRTGLAAALDAGRYEPVPAWSLASALEAAISQAIDLIVLDFVIDGAPAIELCRQLRSMERLSDTPILFLSASTASTAYRDALAAGADDFLTKPVHRGELMLRIRSLLMLRDVRRELVMANDRLVAQRDALLVAQRQREELMGFIVHDLKNPLASIVANASFVVSAPEMTADVRGAVGSVERAAEDMLRMVFNLLDVARAERGSLEPRLARVDLSQMIEEAVQLMQRRAAAREVTLSIERAPHGLEVWVDADLLRRLLENLLDNAVRYTPPGQAVRVDVERGERQVSLRVKDRGPGIPEALRARIFDQYAQLDRAVDSSQKRFGRGLGLTFVRLAVEAHGGRISVEDDPRGGAVFHVCLPDPDGRREREGER